MKARRVVVADQMVRDDESVVLLGHTVIHLSPLATVIMALTADWTDTTDITAKLVEHFGAPPDGVAAIAVTEAALNDLQQQGLIDRD